MPESMRSEQRYVTFPTACGENSTIAHQTEAMVKE